MDPADVTQLQAIVAEHGQTIVAYEEQLTALQNTNKQLLQALANPTAPRIDPVHIAMPDKFNSFADNCKGFLRQCDTFFLNQLNTYHSEKTKCAFFLMLLTRRALEGCLAGAE